MSVIFTPISPAVAEYARKLDAEIMEALAYPPSDHIQPMPVPVVEQVRPPLPVIPVVHGHNTHNEYNIGSYTHMDRGYQNPEIARCHAKHAVAIIEANRQKDETVTLCGMDGSSTFCAAFVKAEMPSYNFGSGSKDGEYPDIKARHGIKDKRLFVLVDDCCTGANCASQTLKAVQLHDPGCRLLVIVMSVSRMAHEFLEGLNVRLYVTQSPVRCEYDGWKV